MKILITGTSGRVGSTILKALAPHHEVIGLDKKPGPATTLVADINDQSTLRNSVRDADVIVHAAALHAPHVADFTEVEFQQTNVVATEKLALFGIELNIKHFIFISTTALYGYASTPPNTTGWIDESVKPKPKTIYHRSKIEAENKLQQVSAVFALPVTVLQMSRCFPEAADVMAIYRLSRGIDARDVAKAVGCSIDKRIQGFSRFIISSKTPFDKMQCGELHYEADRVMQRVAPSLADAFKKRGWALPKKLDRVYDSSLAQRTLGWHPDFGFEEVLSQLDSHSNEVLPKS